MFVALTVQEYGAPFARPGTRIGLAAPLPTPEGAQVAVYWLIGAPPSLAGGVNARIAWPLPGVAEVIAGAPGTVRGVTDTADETVPPPAELVAVSVHEYAVPLASPGTTIGDTDPAAVNGPGAQLAV